MESNAFGFWPVGALVAAGIVIWAVFFASLWFAVIHLMARIGGWKRLAGRYAAAATPTDGKVFRAVTGTVGMTRYKRALVVTASEAGLHIVPGRIFRHSHRPLLIPWTEVYNARPSTLFFRPIIAFEVGSPAVAKMQLPLDVFAGSPVKIG